MEQGCEFCERPIRESKNNSVCLGDHPDREGSNVVLHIDCPCPVHYFEADRQYFSPGSEANSSDDGATVEEIIEDVIDENPDLVDDDE